MKGCVRSHRSAGYRAAYGAAFLRWGLIISVFASGFAIPAQSPAQQWENEGTDGIKNTNAGSVHITSPVSGVPALKVGEADFGAYNYGQIQVKPDPAARRFGIVIEAPDDLYPNGGIGFKPPGAGNGGWINWFNNQEMRLFAGSTHNAYGRISFHTTEGWNSAERMRIETNGKVGIGTPSPTTTLDVNGPIRSGGAIPVVLMDATTDDLVGGLFIRTGGAERWWIKKLPNTNNLEIGNTNIAGHVLIKPMGGNVGIGSLTPAERLHVEGNIAATGNIIAGGTINAKYQDVAEWVPARRPLPAGTVVVVDRDEENHVLASSKAYDTRVAGVVSEQPGLSLGEAGAHKVQVATTGRVKVKADASRKPIRAGDLLVTGDKEGRAMISEPIEINGRAFHQPGTLLGKALESLDAGEGDILVLLTLQ